MSGTLGGRPRGAERMALREAARTKQQQGIEGATWRELAEMAQVGFQAAKRTCWNMVMAGELVVVRHEPRPGSNKPQAIFMLVDTAEPRPDAGAELQSILSGWGAPTT